MKNIIKTKHEMPFEQLAQNHEQVDCSKRSFSNAVGDEDVSRREANVKHFSLGSNRYQAVVYPDVVHYRNDENDQWHEIDNTLEEVTKANGRKVFQNRSNRIHAEFPVCADDGNMISISANGKEISWQFEHTPMPSKAKVRSGEEIKQERLLELAKKHPKFVGLTDDVLKSKNLSEVLESEQERRGGIPKHKAENKYEEILPGVSVRYMMYGETIKEDIILANAEALKNAALRFPNTYEYKVCMDQSLQVIDKESGTVAFTMNPPYVYDAEGNSTIAKVVLTDCNSYFRLEYKLDSEFMNAAVFPVTIDPVINSSLAILNIQDTTLCKGGNVTPDTETYMKIGISGGVRFAGLMKFKQLARLTSSDTVINAVLQIAPKNSSESKYIGAYEVLKPWDAATVTWLNFDPDDDNNVSKVAQECIPGSSNTWLNFDLTNLYRKWCTNDTEGNSNNNGVAFMTPVNVTGENYSELHSANADSVYRPVMYVNYISHAGIEGWWEYERMSAGRAGTVYADLFNGNMVLEHADTAMTGNRNPVSVNHYYNSCRSNVNSFGAGFGWKTGVHQKVTLRTHNNRNYYVWEDGDGTEHFFEIKDAQPYKDSEGMDLELRYYNNSTVETYADDWLTITDKEHNVMHFKVIEFGLAWLTYTQDACSNRSNWTYVSGHEKEGRIDYITDPVGRKTEFEYNADGLISEIKIPGATDEETYVVSYAYDSNKRLVGISYSDLEMAGYHSTYDYDGETNMLVSMRNFDGIGVNVGYEAVSLYNSSVIINGVTDQMRRIVSLETNAVEGENIIASGAKLLFEYKPMCTEITTVDNAESDAGKKKYYAFYQ